MATSTRPGPQLAVPDDTALELAAAVDIRHRRAMDTFADEAAELHRPGRRSGTTRRQMLVRAGAGAAVLSFGGVLMPVDRLIPAAAAQDLTDIDIGVFAESVELAAVAAYQAAIDTGILSVVGAEIGTLFAEHHREHAAAFAGLVGDAATGQPNQAVLDEFAPMVEAASEPNDLLMIALALEEGAAATYHFGLGLIQDPGVATAPAQILPIESEHAVVLAQILDNPTDSYLPTFQNSEAALSPEQYPVSAGS